jgi:tagaturonate reductase
MTKRIIQFGTSRFLQAHADLFVHEARLLGQDIGPITVVKSTKGPERSARVSAFASSKGFPVIIRGLDGHTVLDQKIFVKSVDQGLVADEDWPAVQKLFSNEAEIVISNVGESGYAIPAADEIAVPKWGDVPEGYPAKLLSLLLARFNASGKPMLILPCELVSENGKILRRLLEQLSNQWHLNKAFKTWLATEITICDTLVDRIVSEAIEPIGAVAEPYALWAIKRVPNLDFPFSHPSIILTDDLTPFVRLKLHILNLGHSFLAEIWQSENRPRRETVREILDVDEVMKRLMALYSEEVIPGFACYNMAEQATDYVATTMRRFQNPFLNHQLSDIAQNHQLKIERRAVDFIKWIKLTNFQIDFTRLQELIDCSQLRKT